MLRGQPQRNWPTCFAFTPSPPYLALQPSKTKALGKRIVASGTTGRTASKQGSGQKVDHQPSLCLHLGLHTVPIPQSKRREQEPNQSPLNLRGGVYPKEAFRPYQSPQTTHAGRAQAQTHRPCTPTISHRHSGHTHTHSQRSSFRKT